MQRNKLVSMCFILCLSLSVATLASCNKKVVVHPGAVSTFDSQVYDALITSYGAIQQAKAEYNLKHLPTESKDIINGAITTYNETRLAWLAYRDTVSAGTTGDSLTKAQAKVNALLPRLTDFITSLRALFVKSLPAPTPAPEENFLLKEMEAL